MRAKSESELTMTLDVHGPSAGSAPDGAQLVLGIGDLKPMSPGHATLARMGHSDLSMSIKGIGGNLLAVHEAGHAVAACVLRLSLQYVTIRPRGGESGATRTRTVENRSVNYLAREATLALSGVAAEWLLNGRVILGSDWGDMRMVREIADQLGVVDYDGFVATKRHEAEEVIAMNREAVKAVSRDLIKRRTLAGSEVRRIVFNQQTGT
jgi:ATP-dependent Zn protease